MVKIFNEENSLINTFIAELRDVNIQGDSMRFRRNLERIGEVMAYELSKSLSYESKVVETPLGSIECTTVADSIVIVSVLRAGVPFHNGFLNYFDRAQSGFVGAYRKYSKDGTFNIRMDYISVAALEGKTLLLVDPMLATGNSLVLTYQELVKKCGVPASTHVCAVIASDDGMSYVKQHMPKDCNIWCGAVDQELTVKSYIVPGLGDAGDLAYGEKL